MPIVGVLRERITVEAGGNTDDPPRYVDFYIESLDGSADREHLNTLEVWPTDTPREIRKEYEGHYYGAVMVLGDYRADFAQDNFESLKEMCRAHRR